MILRGVEDIKKGMKEFGRDLTDFPETFIKALQDMPLKPENLQALMPKNSSLDKVKKRFGINAAGVGQIESQMKLIGTNYVTGTFEWLKGDEKYLTWMKAQASPFLCVSGPPGTGKTYFTYNLCSMIQEHRKSRRLAQEATKTQENISVAYFFFSPGLTLASALSNIIVQIAGQDPKFCENLAKDIDNLVAKADHSKKESKEDVKTLWTSFLSSKLERKEETKRQIYILLDGIDELEGEDAKSMLSFFQGLSCDKTAIQVMMTGYPEALKNLKLGKRCDIDLLEKTKAKGDIKKIIEDRIRKLVNLKSFSPKGRQDIVEHLNTNTDGMF
jgi:Cdc6-like AAA superfamily ATPase